ncbi:hypothetical protein EE612_029112 [Oryza sativa]|nr:hypothetical protein EE612_029112 [Oryza sativa]
MVDHSDGISQSRERLVRFSWIVPQVAPPQHLFLSDSPRFLHLQCTGCSRFDPDNGIFDPLFQRVQTELLVGGGGGGAVAAAVRREGGDSAGAGPGAGAGAAAGRRRGAHGRRRGRRGRHGW